MSRIICTLRGHKWSVWIHQRDGKFHRFCYRCKRLEVVGYTEGKHVEYK